MFWPLKACALDVIDAQYIRDVKPGEVIIIDKSGLKSKQVQEANRRAFAYLNTFTLPVRTAL